jgi:hypothetical protein
VSSSKLYPRASCDIETLAAKYWQDAVEPLVAAAMEAPSALWRRHRAQIGGCVIECVASDDHISQLFTRQWYPARAATPDAYCYVLPGASAPFAAAGVVGRTGTVPGAALCLDLARAVLLDTTRFAVVRRVCLELAQHLSQRQARTASHRNPQGAEPGWRIVHCACAEYQAASGHTRSVTLVGPAGSGKTLHAYSLACAKPENGLVCQDVACLEPASGMLAGVEACLWIPTAMAANYPHLVAVFAMSPGDPLELPAELREILEKYRNAADLSRALANGSVSEELFTALADHVVAAPNAHVLVEPRELVGADRCVARSQPSDVIALTRSGSCPWILQTASAEQLLGRLRGEPSSSDAPGAQQAADIAQWDFLERLVRTAAHDSVEAAVVNTRLSPAMTQFCLRRYLEGGCDAIRILPPGECAQETSLLAHLGVMLHREPPASQDSSEGCVGYQGCRPIELVCFEKAGQRIEVMAVDPGASGYAQIKAVWPEHVAEFFTRHTALHVRELFSDVPASRTMSLR